jgi:excisionase family DNA binding protein
MEQLTFEKLPQAITLLLDKLNNIEKILLCQANNKESKTDQLLTIKQTAEFLSLSIPTIYGLVAKHMIPVNKRGKRLYFSKYELTDWIKSGRKLTTSEIENQADEYLENYKKKRL